MDGNGMNELDRALADIWDSLTDEQKEKAKNCETPEALIELASKEGIELPDEVLSAVAGGYITTAWHGQRKLYEAVMDDTGKKIGKYLTQSAAEKAARDRGQSTEMVARSFVEKLRKDSGTGSC